MNEWRRPTFTGKQIVRMIEDEGSSMAQLGRELDPPVTKTGVRMTVYGISRSDRIAEKVASFLRISKEGLWTHWYRRAA